MNFTNLRVSSRIVHPTAAGQFSAQCSSHDQCTGYVSAAFEEGLALNILGTAQVPNAKDGGRMSASVVHVVAAVLDDEACSMHCWVGDEHGDRSEIVTAVLEVSQSVDFTKCIKQSRTRVNRMIQRCLLDWKECLAESDDDDDDGGGDSMGHGEAKPQEKVDIMAEFHQKAQAAMAAAASDNRQQPLNPVGPKPPVVDPTNPPVRLDVDPIPQVGASDIFPNLVPKPLQGGGINQQGGMLMGPNHPAFNQGGNPPHLGGGQGVDMRIPQGARYDPMGPMGPFSGEPDNDLFQPPGPLPGPHGGNRRGGPRGGAGGGMGGGFMPFGSNSGRGHPFL